MFNLLDSWLFAFVIFGGSAILMGMAKETQKKRTFFKKLLFFCALALPILYAAYRTSGHDTFRYMYQYVTMESTPWAELFEETEGFFAEWGHLILTKCLTYLTSVRLYLGAYAALTVCLFYAVTKYIKEEKFIFVMFMFYLGTFSTSFNIMRQCLAIAIVAYSMKFVFERNFGKFVLCIFVASMFHTSAIFVSFIYFLWTRSEKPISGFLIAIMLIVIAVVAVNLDSLLGMLENADFESASLNQYLSYTENSYDSQNREFFLSFAVSCALAVQYSALVKIDKKNGFFITLFFISTCLCLCGFVSPFAKRISMYFSISLYWVLADIPKCFKEHKAVWLARVLIVVYVVLRFSITAALEQSALVPYIWILPNWARF